MMYSLSSLMNTIVYDKVECFFFLAYISIMCSFPDEMNPNWIYPRQSLVLPGVIAIIPNCLNKFQSLKTCLGCNCLLVL